VKRLGGQGNSNSKSKLSHKSLGEQRSHDQLKREKKIIGVRPVSTVTHLGVYGNRHGAMPLRAPFIKTLLALKRG
jgi:hypothetical protein